MRFVPILFAVSCLALAAFCAFGFLASFEPVPHALAWRLGYATLGVGSLAGTFVALRRVTRRTAAHFDEPRARLAR